MPLVCLVLFVSALALFWNRSGVAPRIGKRDVAFALLLELPLGGLSLVSLRAIGSLDEPSAIAPFEPLPDGLRPSHPTLQDVPFELWPWHVLSRRILRGGELPLWNPSSGGGAPLLGNGQAAPFSIPFLLALPLSDLDSWAFLLSLRIPLAFLGSFLLARRSGLSPPAARFAAVSFALSAFVVCWMSFPIGFASALAPTVLLGVHAAATTRTRGGLAVLLASQVLFVLVGHPETTAFTELAAAAYTLALLAGRAPGTRLRAAVRVFVPTVTSALLAAPFLLPTLEATSRSYRFAERHTIWPFWLREPMLWRLKTAFSPYLWGTSRWSDWGFEMAIPECGSFVGSAAIALLPFAFPRRERLRPTLFWFLLAAFLVAVVSRFPPLWHSLEWLPLVGAAHWERWRLFGVLSFAVMAGAGLETLLRAADRGRRIAATLALLAASALPIVDVARVPKIAGRALPMLAVAVVSAALLLLARRRFLPLLVPLSAAQLLLLFVDFTPVVPKRLLPVARPAVRALAGETRGAPFRIGGVGTIGAPNTLLPVGLEDVRLNEPVLDARAHWLLSHRFAWSFDYLREIGRPDRALLDLLGVRYWLAPEGAAPPHGDFPLVAADARFSVFRNPTALPRFFRPDRIRNVPAAGLPAALLSAPDLSSTVLVAEAGAVPGFFDNGRGRIERLSSTTQRSRLLVSADRPMLIASSVPSPEGWRVRASGEPLRRVVVDGAFLGFLAPPGVHVVEVVFRPRSFDVGLGCSALGLVLAVLILRRNR